MSNSKSFTHALPSTSSLSCTQSHDPGCSHQLAASPNSRYRTEKGNISINLDSSKIQQWRQWRYYSTSIESAVEDNNRNLVPTVDYESMKTFSSTVPNITNDQIKDIIDLTADDIQLENFQAIDLEKRILNIANDKIINMTNSSSTDEGIPGHSSSDTLFLDNDVRTSVQNKSIKFINISDESDDEYTSNHQTIKKPNSFKSVSERQNISTTGKSKASYFHHLHNGITKWEEKNKTRFENAGSIINKQKMSTYSMKPIMFEKKVVNISKPHVFSTVKTLHNSKRKWEEEKVFDNLTDNFGTIIFDKKLLKNPSFQMKQIAVKISKPQLFSTVTTSRTNRKLRPIIIDGLNIGHTHGSGTLSVKGIEICIQFFTDRGHKDVVAFIPNHRTGPPGSEINSSLNNLLNKGQVCLTPSRKINKLRMTCHNDRIMLEYANKCDGVVVSNDNFRDLYDENEAFREIIENRLVMVTFVKDDIIVPDDQYNRGSNILFLSDILCFPE